MTVFFFQAEDGIRDDLVTGVQTCALPILGHAEPAFLRRHRGRQGSRRGAEERADPRRRRVVGRYGVRSGAGARPIPGVSCRRRFSTRAKIARLSTKPAVSPPNVTPKPCAIAAPAAWAS